MSMLGDLNGKCALVTGGSSGIGASVARALGAHGAKVVVHYNTRKTEAEAIAKEIASVGGEAYAIGGDMTSSAEAVSLVNQAVSTLGALDILINNVGHFVVRTRFADFTDEDYDAVMRLNVRSLLVTSKAAHPPLKESGKGVIINTGSIAGRNGGLIGSGLYAAAKAQVHSVSKGMATEFAADGIRVNTVAPGFVNTPFHKDTPKERIEVVKNTVPLRRVAGPDDIAGAFLFLASNNMSGYITGQTIDVNGGQLMP